MPGLCGDLADDYDEDIYTNNYDNMPEVADSSDSDSDWEQFVKMLSSHSDSKAPEPNNSRTNHNNPNMDSNHEKKPKNYPVPFWI